MIPREDPLDFMRPPVGKCLGGVFLAHDCDLRLFESMLITLLPIHTDPQADPARFLDEGRRRLRETPVIVAMDAKRYRGRRRLPHDLILIRGKRDFQLKLSLLLFEDHARLAVGSSNLNEGGCGGNAELVARLELNYESDAALLTRVGELIAASGVHGQTWERFTAQLDHLVQPSRRTPTQPWLLSTSPEGSVLEQFLQRIPKKAKIDRVGVLVASQAEDDTAAETDIYRTLLAWLAKRRAGDVPFDIGLPWEVPAVIPPAAAGEEAGVEGSGLDRLLGKVCARIVGSPGEGTISWLVPRLSKGQSITCQLAGRMVGISKRKLKEDVVHQRLWPVEEVVGTGPIESLQYIAEHASVEWWLFPELRLTHGAVYRRPLHAKLVLVATREGKRRRTHLLIGAPNLPPRGLPAEALMEAGLYFTRDKELSLPDLNDELIPCPPECLYLQASTFPTVEPVADSGLEDAVFDAERRSLTLNWQTSRVQRRVIYARSAEQEETIFDDTCAMQNVIPDFELDRACAEVRVVNPRAGERSVPVPIRVIHMAQLLAEEPAGELTFSDLVQLRAGGFFQRPVETDVTDSEIAWGELGPTTVFRALEALVAEVDGAGASLGAFDVALNGPLGVRRFAERLLHAEVDPQLRASEAWVYGHELVRALMALEFADDQLGRTKRAAVSAFISELTHRLALFAPTGPATAVLKKFYKVGSR